MTTPETLVGYITTALAQIKAIQSDIEGWKAELTAHHEAGTIPDKLSTPFGTATLTQRTTWAYSSAVRQLQELEQLEGVATKKLSSSWTIRPATSEQPDF